MNGLDVEKMVELKDRIEGLKNLDNGEKYLEIISKMIKPNKQGLRNIRSLDASTILELYQFLDNIEAKKREMEDNKDIVVVKVPRLF